MNKILVYKEDYNLDGWLDHLQTMIFSNQLQYLASDLIVEGLTMQDIQEGIQRALVIGRAAGMDVRQHFMPIYTAPEGGVFRDCKTSRLGLAMILLNASPSVAVTGQWQLKVLTKYLELS